MTIKDAWLAAEKTCFNQLVTRIGSKAGADAFQGWLPEDRDSWMFSSGGNSSVFPMERVWGDTPLFCQLSFNAKALCRYQDRDDCLRWGGRIISAFNDAKNFRGIGNVLQLQMMDMPSEPTPIQLDAGVLIWSSEIPMMMVFSTSTEF